MNRTGRCGHEVVIESLDFDIEENDFVVVVTWCSKCEERDKFMYVQEKGDNYPLIQAPTIGYDIKELWRRTVNEYPHVSNLVEELKEAGHMKASNDLLEIYNGMVEHGEKLQLILSLPVTREPRKYRGYKKMSEKERAYRKFEEEEAAKAKAPVEEPVVEEPEAEEPAEESEAEESEEETEEEKKE